MESKWSSRKFWAAMGWQAVFTWLLFHDKLPPTVYEGMTWVTLGAYFVANVGDKIAARGMQ